MITYAINNNQSLSPNRWLDYKLFHKLNKLFKSLQYIGRNNNFSPHLTSEQQALGFTIKFTKDNRPYLPSSSNKVLINQLNTIGFFDVFSTNCANDKDGFGVYLSQVIMFLEYGIEWVRKGFKMPASSMEIHHLNSNVLDNRITNLEVVTKVVHSFITNIQIGQHHVHSVDKQFFSADNKVPTNKGNWLTTYKDVSSRLGQLIKRTLDSTITWLKQNLALSVKKSEVFHDHLTDIINDICPDFLKDELYVPLDDSHEKALMALSLNWLIKRTIPDIKTIYKNLKGAASVFMKSLFHKASADDIFKALVA